MKFNTIMIYELRENTNITAFALLSRLYFSAMSSNVPSTRLRIAYLFIDRKSIDRENAFGQLYLLARETGTLSPIVLDAIITALVRIKVYSVLCARIVDIPLPNIN